MSGPGIVPVRFVGISELETFTFVYPVVAATKEKTFERVLRDVGRFISRERECKGRTAYDVLVSIATAERTKTPVRFDGGE